MADRATRMQAIYDQVPGMDGCKGNCWLSCGPVSMTRWEHRRLALAGHPVTPDQEARRSITDFWCEALGPDGRCLAYAIRPLICRIWGTVDWLPCPWGCRPVGGWLPNETAFRLLLEAEQIGGSRHPVPADAFEKLRDPAMVAELAAELGRPEGRRGQGPVPALRGDAACGDHGPGPAPALGKRQTVKVPDSGGNDRMRALTVRQPWAHMIAHCGKAVENRGQPTRYQGLIAVHAGAYSRWDRDGETDPRCRLAWREWSRTLPPMNVTGPLRKGSIHIDFGAVIAVAEIAGCHLAGSVNACTDTARCSPWAHRHAWHWLLGDVRLLSEPVPCRGMLGLWRLPDDAEKAVREQLEASDDDS